jgi:hypothetical protein
VTPRSLIRFDVHEYRCGHCAAAISWAGTVISAREERPLT